MLNCITQAEHFRRTAAFKLAAVVMEAVKKTVKCCEHTQQPACFNF